MRPTHAILVILAALTAGCAEAPGHYVVTYTREPLERHVYDTPLAFSMHLALGENGGDGGATALNENYGVLFPVAIPTEDPDIFDTRTLRSPYLFRHADGTFGVVAVRADREGTPDASADSAVLYFTSPDLLRYEEVGLLSLGTDGGVNAPGVVYDRDTYVVWWTDDEGAPHHTTFDDLTDPTSRSEVYPSHPELDEVALPELNIPGATASSVLAVSDGEARALEVRFGRIASVAAEVPVVTTEAGSPVEMGRMKATVTYSDGSTALYPVRWDPANLQAVDWALPGDYTVTGTIDPMTFPFPFIDARADPSIRWYDGRYYFIATDDTNGGHVRSPGMPMRAAATLEGLRDAPESLIVGPGPADMAGCFWAPELHMIDESLHVFFAPCVGEASWTRVQAHDLELRAGDPLVPDNWHPPEPVLQADGSPLQLSPEYPGISLDMTYFEVEGTSYVAWSQRYIVDDLIGDAEVWIATVDPDDPTRLTSDPVTLITPEYGWDRNHALVAEGSYVTQRDGTVYLGYSGSAVGPTYVMGLLTAPVGADLLDPEAWTKLNYPILKTDVERSQWGPGHHIFLPTEDGLLLVYHAKTDPRSPERHTGIRRVHWAADGMPILDMTPNEAVAPEIRAVEATVRVTP